MDASPLIDSVRAPVWAGACKDTFNGVVVAKADTEHIARPPVAQKSTQQGIQQMTLVTYVTFEMSAPIP